MSSGHRSEKQPAVITPELARNRNFWAYWSDVVSGAYRNSIGHVVIYYQEQRVFLSQSNEPAMAMVEAWRYLRDTNTRQADAFVHEISPDDREQFQNTRVPLPGDRV